MMRFSEKDLFTIRHEMMESFLALDLAQRDTARRNDVWNVIGKINLALEKMRDARRPMAPDERIEPEFSK